jgi:hypothetical protein
LDWGWKRRVRQNGQISFCWGRTRKYLRYLTLLNNEQGSWPEQAWGEPIRAGWKWNPWEYRLDLLGTVDSPLDPISGEAGAICHILSRSLSRYIMISYYRYREEETEKATARETARDRDDCSWKFAWSYEHGYPWRRINNHPIRIFVDRFNCHMQILQVRWFSPTTPWIPLAQSARAEWGRSTFICVPQAHIEMVTVQRCVLWWSA